MSTSHSTRHSPHSKPTPDATASYHSERTRQSFFGHVSETYSPDTLRRVLSGIKNDAATAGFGPVKKTYVHNLPAGTLVGFFPEPATMREIAVVRYEPGVRVLPAVFLRADGTEWQADPCTLSAAQLEKKPLVLIEGDARFIKALLHLVAKSAGSKFWTQGVDREKWAIALLLPKWLRDSKPNWDARALEFAALLKMQTLLRNTLQQKVLRLLKQAR